MKVEVASGNHPPSFIKEEWSLIFAKNPRQNPFLSPFWGEVWLNHFGASLETRLFLFRDDGGSLQGLGYFVESTMEGKKGLSLLGSQDVWDYRDFIIYPGREQEFFQSLASLFKENSWEYIELNSIAEFSPTAAFFPMAMESIGFRVTQEVEETVVNLQLPSTWEDFLERLNAKDRHELRRKIRRIEREGSCEWTRMTDLSSLEEKMGLFLDLHRKSRRDKSEFMSPKMESYFRDLGKGLLAKGWLDLSFLRFQEKEIAAFFSFDFGGTKYVYNSGYDPLFSWYSPGIVLSAYCIRGAIEKGLKGFNFLRGREDYKYHLGGREEINYRLRAEKK